MNLNGQLSGTDTGVQQATKPAYVEPTGPIRSGEIVTLDGVGTYRVLDLTPEGAHLLSTRSDPRSELKGIAKKRIARVKK